MIELLLMYINSAWQSQGGVEDAEWVEQSL